VTNVPSDNSQPGQQDNRRRTYIQTDTETYTDTYGERETMPHSGRSCMLYTLTLNQRHYIYINVRST